MREEEREEKIKKLREMSKKEIEEAHSLVRGTEDIIKEEPRKQKIKIPEIESEISELVIERPRTNYSREEEFAKEPKRETPLEETVEREHREHPQKEKEAHVQYNIFRQEFQGQKTEDIYNSVRDVYHRLQSGGPGPTSDEMNRINAATSVTQQREEQIGRGEYGRISQEVSEKLVLTEKMGSWLSRMYKH